MGFWGRIGDTWNVLTGVVEVKYDEKLIVDGEEILIAELKAVDTTEKKFDISTIGGDLNKWVQENCTPRDCVYEIDGDIVKIAGNLPVKEMK